MWNNITLVEHQATYNLGEEKNPAENYTYTFVNKQQKPEAL